MNQKFTVSEDIAEFCCQGITVDDDNKPSPENAWAPPPAQPDVGGYSHQFAVAKTIAQSPMKKESGTVSHGMRLEK